MQNPLPLRPQRILLFGLFPAAAAVGGAARPLPPITGRHPESGWEIAIGDQPAASYLVRIAR